MMNLAENRSKIWFKVVSGNYEPIDESNETWSFPKREVKGNKMDFSMQQAKCLYEHNWIELDDVTGTWLVSNPKELYAHRGGRKIYVAELLANPSHELPGIIWVHQVRLVREATNLDLKRFDIFRAFRQEIGKQN